MKRTILPFIFILIFTSCSTKTNNLEPQSQVIKSSEEIIETTQIDINSTCDYEINNNKTYNLNKANKTKTYKKDKKKCKNYSLIGIASYYGPKWHGRTTANGEKLNIYAMTAAHKTLPFNTLVKVTDLESGKSVIVRINDRGPYIPGRIIDLTDYAAKKLGILKKGITKVKIEIIG